MRILIISKEAWRDEQNGGNVLSNIFSSFNNAQFAQIYCTDAEPNNSICTNYFQITDKMMIESLISGKRAGEKRIYNDFPRSTSIKKESYYKLKQFGSFTRLMREVVWGLGKWNFDELIKFAKEFNPDIIFAPCYGNHYMIKLTKIINKHIKKPIISYISDDFYSNREFILNPFIWLNHKLLRKHVREVFKLYKLTYTMTEEQKSQCEKDFNANMKILCKGGVFLKEKEKISVNNPIRIVYGGGIYINRWKTLIALADAIRNINKNGEKIILDIYTNTELKEMYRQQLNDGTNVNMHPPVSLKELFNIYKKSDIALHCEGFDKKSRNIVRLSFSTKIVDCLDSGCAVMAICHEEQAGFAYLKRNDAAICISNLEEIENTLNTIINNPNLIIEYQHKAFELGQKRHSIDKITAMLKQDFQNIINL